MTSRDEEIEILPARPEHEAEVLELLASALRWDRGPAGMDLFRWKHRENPFGPSAEWVAVAAGRVVGYRAFQRWELERDGAPVRVVRAVDTATSPEYRGRGIFTRLTLGALDALRADGVEFVFNTPNSQSRPGYLKMGWEVVGRLPVSGRVGSLRGLARAVVTRRSGGDARRPVDAVPAREALSESESVRELLASMRGDARLHTLRTVEYLQWRYRPDALGYRAVVVGGRARDGLAVFRVRPRGSLVAASICEVLVPAATPGAGGRLVRAVADVPGVDYVVRLARSDVRRGFVRLPGRGPVLTWRGLRDGGAPGAGGWNLEFGDVELF